MTSKPVVHLMKPDKPISKMTDEERQAFADKLFDALSKSTTKEK